MRRRIKLPAQPASLPSQRENPMEKPRFCAIAGKARLSPAGRLVSIVKESQRWFPNTGAGMLPASPARSKPGYWPSLRAHPIRKPMGRRFGQCLLCRKPWRDRTARTSRSASASTVCGDCFGKKATLSKKIVPGAIPGKPSASATGKDLPLSRR